MKQVVQTRTGLTVVRDVPAPPCPPGSVLVRNRYSVISSGTERSSVAGSQKSLLAHALERPELVRRAVDQALTEGVGRARRSISERRNEERPAGYSSAGEVIEVGARVSGVDRGELVACAGAGHANHAEVVSVPANLCATVPTGVSPKTAAMTTIAAIALHAIRVAEVSIGDRVAVVGCGLVGQLACRLLKASGAMVFALDLDPRRCEIARRGGADHAIAVDADSSGAVLSATNGLGVDEVLVTAASATSAPLLLAMELVRERGAVVLVGDVQIDLPRAPLYRKELSFRVSRSYGPGRYDPAYEQQGLDYPIGYVRWTLKRNMDAVLELQARQALKLDDLVEAEFPVERAADAYALLTGSAEQRPVGAIALRYDAAEPAPSPSTPSDQRHLGAAVGPSAAPPRPISPGTPTALRIGLIGPGEFASRVLVPALVTAGARLQVVGGGSGLSADVAARRLGFERVAASETDVLRADDVDAIVIATRHASHASLAAQALDAGKHVFCEKPLALTVEELDAVLAAAASSARVLAVGFNRRFAPLFVELRQFVGASTGRLTAVYRVSAGRIPPEHWVHDLAEGGGRALGEVCHFVDTLLALVGQQVSIVHAAGFGPGDAPIQARDNLVVTLGMGDGSVAAIVYAGQGSARLPKERLEVFAEGRTAVLDDYRKLELYDGTSARSSRVRGHDKGHVAELRAFIDGIRDGTPPVELGDVANASLATLAIVESLRCGLPVKVEA